MESHVTEGECEENSEGIECEQCYIAYKTEEEFNEHINDGQECDQCKKWVCFNFSLKNHKKKYCEMTNKTGRKDGNEVTQTKTIESQLNQSGEDSSQKDEMRLELAEELKETKTIECI